jgi:toxin ParE1/3/4
MSKVRHTALARADLIRIWVDIALDDPAAADRVYDCLDARVKILQRFPEAGMARPDIAKDARVLVESPYLIVYRLVSGGVQIVRVLHGARDIDGSLFSEGIE